jgi:hypothetical protein
MEIVVGMEVAEAMHLLINLTLVVWVTHRTTVADETVMETETVAIPLTLLP